MTPFKESMVIVFNLPTEEDMIKPEHMSEEDWALLFNAHMKRYDAFFNGTLVGILCITMTIVIVN